jgi:hypothetical protein
MQPWPAEYSCREIQRRWRIPGNRLSNWNSATHVPTYFPRPRGLNFSAFHEYPSRHPETDRSTVVPGTPDVIPSPRPLARRFRPRQPVNHRKSTSASPAIHASIHHPRMPYIHSQLLGSGRRQGLSDEFYLEIVLSVRVFSPWWMDPQG